jgi:hypothetical protein
MAQFWFRLPGPVRTVMVHTKDENSFKGALVDQRRDGFVLRACQYAQVDQNNSVRWTPIDGDVVIPKENISWWQEGLDVALLDITGRINQKDKVV